MFLLRVLGAALLVAGLASALQVSAAVGAFLLGIAISGATAENATKLLEPLRDLFAAVFFVVFGLNTDPARDPAGAGRPRSRWPSSPPPPSGHRLVGGPPSRASARLGRLRAGAALVARGEFSIVIAGLAVGVRRGQPATWPRWPPRTCC